MSYAMTHLIIANEYAKRHDIEDVGMFLLGSIAPDCVHMQPDYTPDKKQRSHHVPEGLSWGSIFIEEHMASWYDRLRMSYETRQAVVPQMAYEARQETALKSFLAGYTLHILVDIFNCKYLYAGCIKKYCGEDKTAFMKEYRSQCIIWDEYLSESYAESEEVFARMESALKGNDIAEIVRTLELESVISGEDVKEYLMYTRQLYPRLRAGDEHFNEEDLDKMYMITKKSSDFFLREVGRHCDEMLYDFNIFDRVFEVKDYEKYTD